MRLQEWEGEENFSSPFSRTKDSSIVLHGKSTSDIVQATENGKMEILYLIKEEVWE